ncbi:ATP-binding protein [Candidatus Gracilibacteria bacterium]|nr:ATP-binding protein [Candidatus Gracilibacteria bacterium]
MGEFKRYKEVIQNSKDLIFWIKRNGDISFYNKSFFNFFKTKNINIKDIDKFFKEKGKWEIFYDKFTTNPELYETVYSNGTENIPVEFYASKEESSFYAVIVAKDITERKRFEFKIKQVTEELIRSNKDLQEFAYIASHDLKEPLRKISMFCNKIVSLEKNISNEGKEYLEKISLASLRMQDMIDSILEYSRVGIKEENFKSCDTLLLIEQAIDNCEASLNFCNSNVSLPDKKIPKIYGDGNQISQLFQNLISNSIKFKKVDVALKIKIDFEEDYKGNRVRFFVEDNGIGIKEGFCEQIFTPFAKLHSQSKYSGHGMGLSICKKIVEKHGGKILAQSTEGEWTKIIFDLQGCKC